MPTNKQIKDKLREEYVRCATDPTYFMKEYCYIQHPVKGKMKFDLYPFQERTLKDFKDRDYNIILKARQLGISTLTAGYSLWLMNFHNDKNILVIATKQEVAKNLVTKVRVMHKMMPEWLKQGCVEDNKLSLRYKNGSQIKAISSTSEAGRSEALSLLVMDEAAFIKNIDEIWAASQQTLATGGKCIALSTPNGMGNWFHKTWTEAEEGTNSFNFIRLHWTVHPERGDEWRNEQNKLLGPDMAAQECDCDFISSGQSVIPAAIIKEYQDNSVCEPIEKRYHDDMWVWKNPGQQSKYIISADVARGDGSDYSAFHVIDVETLEQVAEFKSKVDTTRYANILMSVGTEYNDAILVVENNNVGWAVLQVLLDREYRNLFWMKRDVKYIDSKTQYTNKYRREEKNMIPGFTTSMKSRPLIIDKLSKFVREKQIKINSIRLIDELYVFIFNNGRAEAFKGYNDDLVMSMAIGLWIRETSLRLHEENMRITKETMNKMGGNSGVYIVEEEDDYGWKHRVGDKKESLTWLINR
tara:strand:+ start:1980 stop:3557 length:1578 start_codon:yes stop_codon:yes gene_type:complete